MKEQTQTRTLTITIAVEGMGDEELKPYIDTWLGVWRARGARLGEMIEEVPYDYGRRTLTIRGTVTHEAKIDP